MQDRKKSTKLRTAAAPGRNSIIFLAISIVGKDRGMAMLYNIHGAFNSIGSAEIIKL